MTLRVLHVTHSLGFGGIESQLATLADTPSRDEHEFCAISSGGNAADAILTSGRSVSILDVDPWQNPLRALRSLFLLVRARRPHIVHCHGLEANIWAVAAARLAGVRKTVAEEIGIWDRSSRAKLAISTAYRFAQSIVATSEAVKEFLVKHGVPARKITIIYNPVRFSNESARARVNFEPLRVACVGRLHSVKNPLGLVEAIGAARTTGLSVEAHFIGDGPQRSQLEELAERLGIKSAIIVHGFRRDPHSVLAGCHLYLQPSPAEGFGIAMVEAMGCGLPAICSRFGAAREIVRHGADGWLIEDVAPETMAAAIQVAAGIEPTHLFAMGQAARESVRNRFTPEIYRRHLEAFYDTLS